jgi:2-polyprenyl-6-methoxyphenol hydroxylase-like FAD-dependent oxidoreductase
MMNQSKQANPKVLIVGAGPSGLMMACQLALHNIPFRIIDKKDHPTSYSGALILQARSIEIFYQLGIAQKLIQEGTIASFINMIFNGKNKGRIQLKDIGQGLTIFPNILLLKQSRTEQIMSDFLLGHGSTIHRGCELVSFIQSPDGISATLKHANGKQEIQKIEYLIAADGGHSLIRKQLKIPFSGKTHYQTLFVSDCKGDLNMPPDELCFSFSNEATAGFFPLNNDNWRVDGIISKGLENKSTITFNDINEELPKRLRMQLSMYEPNWFSVFHSHQRYAEKFQEKRCFLIGDAAHIYSPVGAQGMNSGLQDAYNLAWKLAFVIQEKAKPSLLDTYSLERLAIAKNLIQSTDRLFKLVTSQHTFTKKFRVYILPYFLRIFIPLFKTQKFIHQFVFRSISQINIHYRISAYSDQTSLGNFPTRTPKPGDRLPYFPIISNGNQINIQDKLKKTRFHLFIFTKKKPIDEIVSMVGKNNDVLSMETIHYSADTRSIFNLLGIKESGLYLIRPDMHIAYRSNKPNVKHFENYMQQIFNNLTE